MGQLVEPTGTSKDGAPMTDILETMRNRHSARMPYDADRPVPAHLLARVLEAARWAPTAHNMQNYEIVVVDDRTRLQEIAAIRAEVSAAFVRENLAQLSFSEEELRRKKVGLLARMFPPSWLDPDAEPSEPAEHALLGHSLSSAPLLLVVLHDATRRAPASEGDVLGMMSLGCVMQNMWLMAEALGISMQILSAMSGDHVEGELRRLLAFPPHFKVSFGARLGYPLEPPVPALRVRRDVGDFVHRNSFLGSSDE